MKRQGPANEIEQGLRAEFPHAPALPKVYMQMLPWQMLALYGLAWRQCRKGGRILEIGTGFGSSAYMLAKAAPAAEIVSLTANVSEGDMARQFLRSAVGEQVKVLNVLSLAHYAATVGQTWDLIFVDGDHRNCQRDLVWFNRIGVGGLILFHDYSPSACPPVYAAVGKLAWHLHRDPDVRLLDDDDIGMAGFYRQEGESWPE